MNINDNVPFVFRQLRPKNMPKKTADMITSLAKAYGLENIGEIDEQFLNGFICASEIVIAQLEKEFESKEISRINEESKPMRVMSEEEVIHLVEALSAKPEPVIEKPRNRAERRHGVGYKGTEYKRGRR